MTFDCRVQCPRVGLEVKIKDFPAGGIRAIQGSFSSIYNQTNQIFSYFLKDLVSVLQPTYVKLVP